MEARRRLLGTMLALAVTAGVSCSDGDDGATTRWSGSFTMLLTICGGHALAFPLDPPRAARMEAAGALAPAERIDVRLDEGCAYSGPVAPDGSFAAELPAACLPPHVGRQRLAVADITAPRTGVILWVKGETDLDCNTETWGTFIRE